MIVPIQLHVLDQCSKNAITELLLVWIGEDWLGYTQPNGQSGHTTK